MRPLSGIICHHCGNNNAINEDKIKGGKADKLIPKEIADKFDVTTKMVKDQIKKGNPLTITDPSMTRFLMSSVTKFSRLPRTKPTTVISSRNPTIGRKSK